MNKKELYELLDYFQKADINSLEYKDGDTEIKVAKPQAQYTVSAPAIAEQQPAKTSSVINHSMDEVVTAPLVGTFYSSPSPEAEPFVKVGQSVKRGETLCILEAMKALNELPAPFDCEIVGISVQNQEFVGFGQQLFVVKKTNV